MAGHFGEAAIALGYLFHVLFEGIARNDRAQLAFSPFQGAGQMGITTRRPSSAKAVATLSLSTAGEPGACALRGPDKRTSHPPNSPVPCLGVRDRRVPVLSGLVLYAIIRLVIDFEFVAMLPYPNSGVFIVSIRSSRW